MLRLVRQRCETYLFLLGQWGHRVGGPWTTPLGDISSRASERDNASPFAGPPDRPPSRRAESAPSCQTSITYNLKAPWNARSDVVPITNESHAGTGAEKVDAPPTLAVLASKPRIECQLQ